MPNRTEARPAKAEHTNATGRLPLVRLFSTLLKTHSRATFPRAAGHVNELGRLLRQGRGLAKAPSLYWRAMRKYIPGIMFLVTLRAYPFCRFGREPRLCSFGVSRTTVMPLRMN
jgi:hypothetical protein